MENVLPVQIQWSQKGIVVVEHAVRNIFLFCFLQRGYSSRRERSSTSCPVPSYLSWKKQTMSPCVPVSMFTTNRWQNFNYIYSVCHIHFIFQLDTQWLFHCMFGYRSLHTYHMKCNTIHELKKMIKHKIVILS